MPKKKHNFINQNTVQMKKITAILVVAVFTVGLISSSCNSQKHLCPAYPPSTYGGKVIDTDMNQIQEGSFIVEENQI